MYHDASASNIGNETPGIKILLKVRLEECIYLLGDAQITATPDANSRYWQGDINNADHDKEAFTSHHMLKM